MADRYEFHPAAEAEFNNALEYYRVANPELATAFVNEIEGAVDYVLTYPEGSPLVEGEVRSKPVRRFPYDLVYEIRLDFILILAVVHRRRRPVYWLGRA